MPLLRREIQQPSTFAAGYLLFSAIFNYYDENLITAAAARPEVADRQRSTGHRKAPWDRERRPANFYLI